MRKLKFFAGFLAAMMLVTGPAVAQVQEADDAVKAVEEAINEVEQAAADAGVDPKEILQIEVQVDPGDGSDPITVTFEELIDAVTGRALIDSENHGGIFGLPQVAAGNVLHLGVGVVIDTWTGPLSAEPAQPEMGYEVRESGFTPDTPIVPVLNPVFLAGALAGVELPPEVLDVAPGLGMPLLATHMGGRLKHVTYEHIGAGISTHTVGASVLGNNAETSPRETTDTDPWPIWLPLVTGDGFTTVPDERMDFVGFAQVIQGMECAQLNPLGPTLNLPRIRACAFGGTVIGDGVADFDDALGLGALLDPLFQDPPAEVAEVMAAIDDALAQVPVGDVLDQLLELLGTAPPAPELPV